MSRPFLSIVLLAFLFGCDTAEGPAPGETRFTHDDGEDEQETQAYFALPDDKGERIDSEELSFHAQTVVDGLMIPWSLAFLPDGMVLITERQGALRLVRDGELESLPMEGTPQVFAQGQGGLLDIALAPDFEDSGWIYLSYSSADAGGSNTSLRRARLDPDNNRLTDQQDLFTGVPLSGGNRHFGGRLVTRDDDILLSIGDRGEQDEAQSLVSHAGSVVRLSVEGSFPEDNPFVDDPDAQPEIWTYGHRNIQGMAVHPVTGEIWSHEHGPQGGDELNILRAGQNYGWPEVTHGSNYDGTPITDMTEQEGMISPLHHWTPAIAPSGMAFVTGDRYPEWAGNLLIGSLVGQELRRVVLDGEEVVHEETLLQGSGRIRDVRMGPDGYIYLSNESTGSIIRLLPADD